MTWSAHGARIERLAAVFAAAGVARGDRVAICAQTSVGWEVAQMAALRVCASVVGLDPLYADELLARFIVELRVVILVVQDQATLARIPPDVRARLRLVLAIRHAGARSPGVRSIDDLCVATIPRASGESLPAPQDEALVFFSSGTTGSPKPVVYRHDQLTLGVRSLIEAFADLGPGSRLVCWLPLASVFQRMINFAAMARGAVSYVVEDPRAVMEHIVIISPHTFIAVPRFFERVYAAIHERIDERPRISRRMIRAALALGQRRARSLREGVRPPAPVRMWLPLADRFVFRRIRAGFGMNLRYFVSGSAPMPNWLLDWFEGIGLPVLEGYAMSENIVPIAANRYHDRKPGTVGRPFPENDVQLADDGEILVRGPGLARVAAGAHAASTAGNDGVLSTGDLGAFDSGGYLRITGRKGDVFKASDGRWVMPAEIEGRLRHLPYVDAAVAFGAGRARVFALIGLTPPSFAALTASADPARGAHTAEASESPFKRELCRDVAAATRDLPASQRPAGLLVLPASILSVEGGEFTTNLKVRRRHIEAKYASALESLEAGLDHQLSRPGDECLVMWTTAGGAG